MAIVFCSTAYLPGRSVFEHEQARALPTKVVCREGTTAVSAGAGTAKKRLPEAATTTPSCPHEWASALAAANSSAAVGVPAAATQAAPRPEIAAVIAAKTSSAGPAVGVGDGGGQVPACQDSDDSFGW